MLKGTELSPRLELTTRKISRHVFGVMAVGDRLPHTVCSRVLKLRALEDLRELEAHNKKEKLEKSWALCTIVHFNPVGIIGLMSLGKKIEIASQ